MCDCAAKVEAFPAELEAQLVALRAAALASPAREPKQDSKKQRAIPKQLKEMLPDLTCTLNRCSLGRAHGTSMPPALDVAAEAAQNFLTMGLRVCSCTCTIL